MTMASDTHVPEGSGWGIDLVADQARKAGAPSVQSSDSANTTRWALMTETIQRVNAPDGREPLSATE